jgi:predicted nucleic acid-binding Zn ribbon protein
MFVDIGGIVDNHCLNILFCCCCWYWWNRWQSLFKLSFLFVDNNYCQQIHQYQQQQQKRMYKQWFSTILPISTTTTKCLNNDCQQVHEYQQQQKRMFNNDCQRFHQYQQTKKNV